MEKRCDNYVGFACVDGSCPVANYRYFMDEGMPDLAKAFADAGNCNSCAYYRGCEDCALFNSEYCQGNKGVSENGK